MRDIDCVGRNLHWLGLGLVAALASALAFLPHGG